MCSRPSLSLISSSPFSLVPSSYPPSHHIGGALPVPANLWRQRHTRPQPDLADKGAQKANGEEIAELKHEAGKQAIFLQLSYLDLPVVRKLRQQFLLGVMVSPRDKSLHKSMTCSLAQTSSVTPDSPNCCYRLIRSYGRIFVP
ncbi:hypothetical protein V8E53_006039 [Lactarius tabidus]